MRRSKEEIIADIAAHLAANGAVANDWFAGVTDRPRLALFTRHGLRPSGDAWISRKAAGEAEALLVRDHLGSLGVMTEASADLRGKFVYAYRRKPHTRP